MYVPPHFAQADPAEVQRILRDHPLGALVMQVDGELQANHLPFEFDPATGPHGTLRAHAARAHPLWQRCPEGTQVLVIFQGTDAYISPNWYPSKHETHRQVPTWNYEVVHAHGTLRVVDDERFVRGLVARLTRHHEATEPKPWKMGDSAPEYIDGLLQQILGIEIAVTSLVAKAKLSQNKDERDRTSAASQLAARGQAEMARLMAK